MASLNRLMCLRPRGGDSAGADDLQISAGPHQQFRVRGDAHDAAIYTDIGPASSHANDATYTCFWRLHLLILHYSPCYHHSLENDSGA